MEVCSVGSPPARQADPRRKCREDGVTIAAPACQGEGRMHDWPRYPRILVAIDEAPAAAFALRHVVPYAIDQRSQLTLVGVVPEPPRSAAAAGMSLRQLADQMETEATTHLRVVA